MKRFKAHSAAFVFLSLFESERAAVLRVTLVAHRKGTKRSVAAHAPKAAHKRSEQGLIQIIMFFLVFLFFFQIIMCQKSADPFNGRACCMFIIFIYIYLILIMINYYDVDSVCLISGVGGSAAQSEKELERGCPRANSCSQAKRARSYPSHHVFLVFCFFPNHYVSEIRRPL